MEEQSIHKYIYVLMYIVYSGITKLKIKNAETSTNACIYTYIYIYIYLFIYYVHRILFLYMYTQLYMQTKTICVHLKVVSTKRGKLLRSLQVAISLSCLLELLPRQPETNRNFTVLRSSVTP